MFALSKQREGPVATVMPEGRLDTLNSARFNEEIQSLLDQEEYLIIDFSRCNYLSSSGIRSLMAAAKKLGGKGGRLMLAGMLPEVFQVIEMTGLHKAFHLFKDTAEARDAILRFKKDNSPSTEIEIGGYCFQYQQINKTVQPGSLWQTPEIAGYDELKLATGIGSPAESPEEDPEAVGLFLTIGNCSGFIPFNRTRSPDFRVVKDPATAGIFLRWALSFSRIPGAWIRLMATPDIGLDPFLNRILQFPPESNIKSPDAILIADRNPANPAISFGLVSGTDDPADARPIPPPELFDFAPVTSSGKRICGASFSLIHTTDIQPDESVLDFCNRFLTIDNIEKIDYLDLTSDLTEPVAWLFYADHWNQAESQRIKVETTGDVILEPYKAFLTRRLYSDSARVAVKPLHGGYSAQTFQVESYDRDGRKLRSTVLKIANRSIISREAERCQQFALPYILNNSAIILGTAFHCDTGALRYNFVGIGGEQTRLKWLAHYYNSWPARELEPLFDKIFLQILKPWYGQTVNEKIHPYLDHDPTLTFFPDLCETAWDILTFSAGEKQIRIEETGQTRLNPYWFLKNEYPARRNREIEYPTSVCHGDLNMQNILLDSDMNVYLIDFSETKPRSVVSDFARLEAIFMIEHAPLHREEDMRKMVEFTTQFYDQARLDQAPDQFWLGGYPEIMDRNLAMTMKMRKYALESVNGDPNIVPYYLALLEWVYPIVCYSSTPLAQKKLSAYVAGLLCEKILECDN